MSDNTKIQWTDATWNPVRGCTKVGAGCDNCYAMNVAHRFGGEGMPYEGLTRILNGRPQWTGKVRLVPEVLNQPLRWKKPRKVFVNSMSDLFHEDVPDSFIDKVFAVMALCPQHTFQVLTKRAKRMREYSSSGLAVRVQNAVDNLEPDGLWTFPGHEPWVISDFEHDAGGDWLSNVWLGVSVEDQATADERIPLLLETPAAVRWISAEPLLAALDVRQWISGCYECGATCGLRLASRPDIERCEECGEECTSETVPTVSEGCPQCSGPLETVFPDCNHFMVYQHPDTACLDWVVAGGESGPNARPSHPDWLRTLRNQCTAAGVPYFFKQWGEWSPNDPGEIILCRDTAGMLPGGDTQYLSDGYDIPMDNDARLEASGDVRLDGRTLMHRVGKRAAGRQLDGREWSEYPA